MTSLCFNEKLLDPFLSLPLFLHANMNIAVIWSHTIIQTAGCCCDQVCFEQGVMGLEKYRLDALVYLI